MAQLVADRAGEVSADDGRLGPDQRRSASGDSARGLGDGDPLVEPAEAGLRAPGLAANQRGVRHVDAD